MRFYFTPLQYFLNKDSTCYGKAWHRAILIGTLVIFVMLSGVSFALQEEGAEVVKRIEALEAANRAIGDQLNAYRLAVAVLQLRIASQTHMPFEAELLLVRQLGREDPNLSVAVEALAAHAVTGVATVAELRDGFGLIVMPKLEPLLEKNDQDWVDWAFSWANMVLIPFSSPSPTSRQQLVIATTDRLTEDDLRGAVEQISQLDGPAAEIVIRWLQEANARLIVDAAYNSLAGIAVAILSNS